MSTSNQANEGLYVLNMHIKLRYMGMRKTLKVYIFFIEHDTEIIQVSLYSWNSYGTAQAQFRTRARIIAN